MLFADRPWLTEGQKVQKLQEKVYLALQHSLHKSVASDEKLDKVETSSHRPHCSCLGEKPWPTLLSSQMVSKLPIMKSICNLHMDKLEFFRMIHPETAYSFPPLYREVFGREMSLPDSTNS